MLPRTHTDQLRFDDLSIADRHDDHVAGHEVLLGHRQRLIGRDRVHLLRVLGVVIQAKVVDEDVREVTDRVRPGFERPGE